MTDIKHGCDRPTQLEIVSSCRECVFYEGMNDGCYHMSFNEWRDEMGDSFMPKYQVHKYCPMRKVDILYRYIEVL